MRKRVAVDFDGVIVPFGPLTGEVPPIDGVGSALELLHNNGYEIIIHTSRLSPTWWKEAYQEFGALDAASFGAAQTKYVRDYLDYHMLHYDRITAEKVPCSIYIDDLATRITKDFSLLNAVAHLLGGPTEAQIAYAAGLIEGEGNIDFRLSRGNSVTVQISMSDKDVIDRIQEIFGNIGGRWIDAREGRKIMYGWKVQSRDQCLYVLKSILPWLGERRSKKAQDALFILQKNRGSNGIRTECPQGHPYMDDNLYVTPTGKRVCKECRRTSGRKYFQNNREVINTKHRSQYHLYGKVNWPSKKGLVKV